MLSTASVKELSEETNRAADKSTNGRPWSCNKAATGKMFCYTL